MGMKSMRHIVLVLMLLPCSSCHQFAQQAIESIPPPAPETLIQPLTPAQKEYYTLPHPI